MWIRRALLNFPSLIKLSAQCVRFESTLRINIPSICPNTEIGMAIVRAVSALEPDRIAKAVAIMDAIFISGGAAAQIYTRPSDINSREAPTNKPFSKSPNTNPTNVLTIKGRSKIILPSSLESKMHMIQTRPKAID